MSLDDDLKTLAQYLADEPSAVAVVEKVRAELLKLRQRDHAWWKAASTIHNADPDSDAERQACGSGRAMKSQLDKLREFIRYWSYCTFNGMRKWCPEKEAELLAVFRELGIQPYAGTPTEEPSGEKQAA